MKFSSPHSHLETCRQLLCAAIVAIATLAQTAAAEPKNFVAKGTTRHELDTKEADLIKRESDLLKQLSAESRSKPKSEETHARLEPSRQQAVKPGPINSEPKSDPVLDNPLAAEQEALIAEKDQQIESLSQEVSKLRNRLLLAETEVERLSSIIDERNKRQMSAYSSSAGQSLYNKKVAAPSNGASASSRAMPAPSDPQDMQVVTVRADKAFLRTGPGEENSPLMTVSRGTRLAVETRSGDWYRIISPAGTRAWVAADVVVFGDMDPTRATRVGGANR